jgi:hypothetical protein
MRPLPKAMEARAPGRRCDAHVAAGRGIPAVQLLATFQNSHDLRAIAIDSASVHIGGDARLLLQGTSATLGD